MPRFLPSAGKYVAAWFLGFERAKRKLLGLFSKIEEKNSSLAGEKISEAFENQKESKGISRESQ